MKVEFYIKNKKYKLTSDRWTMDFDCLTIDDPEIISYAEGCRLLQADSWIVDGDIKLHYPNKENFENHKDWIEAVKYTEDDFINHCLIYFREVDDNEG